MSAPSENEEKKQEQNDSGGTPAAARILPKSPTPRDRRALPNQAKPLVMEAARQVANYLRDLPEGAKRARQITISLIDEGGQAVKYEVGIDYLEYKYKNSMTTMTSS